LESFLDHLQVCDYLATETHPSYNVVDNDVVSFHFLEAEEASYNVVDNNVVSFHFLEAEEAECDTFLL
jgi:hypothetical protein